MPYVMVDDPERMDAGAIIARAVRRALIRNDEPVAGYLYLVCHKPVLPQGRLAVLGSSIAKPALIAILGVVVLATLMAAWIIAAVTRPLRQLTRAVALISQDGLDVGAPGTPEHSAAPAHNGRIRPVDPGLRDDAGNRAPPMVGVAPARPFPARRCQQPVARSALAADRHHGVHLETLESRWQGDENRAADRALVAMALRNTHNAARLVQSLGDLAQLDEPRFGCAANGSMGGELLDDIAVRFAQRAHNQGVTLHALPASSTALAPPVVALDIELFSRARDRQPGGQRAHLLPPG